MTPPADLNSKSFALGLPFAAAFYLGSLFSYLGFRTVFGISTSIFSVAEISLFYFFVVALLVEVSSSTSLRTPTKVGVSWLVVCSPLFGFFAPGLLRVCFGVGGFCGIVLLVRRSANLRAVLPLLLSAFVFSVLCAVRANTYVSWTGVYSPAMTTELAELGLLQKDLFHISSIVAMIKEFGVVSTGVHGLTETSTHYFPYYWVAGLAKIYHLPAIESLGVIFSLVVLPLSVFSFSLVSLSASATERSSTVAWMVLSALLVMTAISPINVLDNFNFATSFILFSLTLPELVRSRSQSFLRNVSLLFPLALACAVFKVKPHTSVFLFLLFVFAAAFGALSRSGGRRKLFVSLLTAGVLLSVIGYALLPRDSVYFTYLRTMKPFNVNVTFPGTAVFYLVAAFSLSVLYLQDRKLRENSNFWSVAFLSAFSAAFIVIRGIPDGNAHYFSFLLATYSLFVLCRSSAVSVVMLRLERAKAARVEQWWAVFVLLAVLYSGYFVRIDFLKERRIITQAQQSNAESLVRDLKAKVSEIKPKKFAVYVPSDQQRLWSTVKHCQSAPFVVPALLERPRLFGLSPKAVCPGLDRTGYGFENIGLDKRRESVSDAELCEAAALFGITSVVEATYSSETVVREIACQKGS